MIGRHEQQEYEDTIAQLSKRIERLIGKARQ